MNNIWYVTLFISFSSPPITSSEKISPYLCIYSTYQPNLKISNY